MAREPAHKSESDKNLHYTVFELDSNGDVIDITHVMAGADDTKGKQAG